MLTKNEMLSALIELGDELQHANQNVSLVVFGGAALALDYEVRDSTKDIDVIFRDVRDRGFLQKAIKDIASKRNFESDWLNDDGKRFITSEIIKDSTEKFVFGGLSVLIPSAEALLATKVCSLRIGEGFSDLSDTIFLMKKCGIKTISDVAALVSHYRPDDAGRTMTQNAALIEDILIESKSEQ